MKQFKKVLSLCLSFAIAVSMLTVFSSATNHEELQNSPLYIISKECPESYITFAKQNIERFIDPSVPISAQLSLGIPFTFSNADSNVFYFPVYIGEEMRYTFRVFEGVEGEICGIMSPVFVKDLNEIAKLTSMESPLKVFLNEEGDVEFYTDGFRKTVLSYPVEIASSPAQSLSADDNEFSVILCEPQWEVSLTNSTRATTGSNYINLFSNSYWPTMPHDYHWCAAYSMSAVMKYCGVDSSYSSPLAVMKTFNKTSKTDEIYLADAYRHAVKWARMSTLKFSYNCLSFLELWTEISNGRPVIISLRNVKNESESNHALVIRGIDEYRASFSVWNCWFDYYETVTSLDNYVPAIGSTLDRLYSYSYPAGETIYNAEMIS